MVCHASLDSKAMVARHENGQLLQPHMKLVLYWAKASHAYMYKAQEVIGSCNIKLPRVFPLPSGWDSITPFGVYSTKLALPPSPLNWTNLPIPKNGQFQKISIPNHGRLPFFNPPMPSEIPKCVTPPCPQNSIIVNPPSPSEFPCFFWR